MKTRTCTRRALVLALAAACGPALAADFQAGAARVRMRIGVNPSGPVDHDVPVLRVAGKDGSLRAVLRVAERVGVVAPRPSAAPGRP